MVSKDHRFFSDEHSANYDQEVAYVRDLLGRSDAWMLIASLPGENSLHAAAGFAPGSLDPRAFLLAAAEGFQSIVERLLGEGEM